MKLDYTKLFKDMERKQKESGLTSDCCRCGKDTIQPVGGVPNAESRYHDLTICHDCGNDEAMRELEKSGPLPAYQWHFIRNILHGRTFQDLMEIQKEFDCELIIGGSDMHAAFVWYEDNKMTIEGLQYYSDIMRAPYEILPNGNIEIFCDSYKLGEDFCLSAAGYTGERRYSKYFCCEELGRDDLLFQSLDYTEHGVHALFLVNADVSDRCQMNQRSNEDYVSLSVYLTPGTMILHGEFHCISNILKEKRVPFYPTPGETGTIVALMGESCKQTYGCSLNTYEQQKGDVPALDLSGIEFEGGIKPKAPTIYIIVDSWDSVDSRLPTPPEPEDEDTITRYVAEYTPKTDVARYLYCTLDPEGDETLEPVKLTEMEECVLRAAMRQYCIDKHGYEVEELLEKSR